MTDQCPISSDLAPPARTPEQLVAARIEERLLRHVDAPAVKHVRDAVVSGQVVRLTAPDEGHPQEVVAYRRGVLFVGGVEYVISEE